MCRMGKWESRVGKVGEDSYSLWYVKRMRPVSARVLYMSV